MLANQCCCSNKTASARNTLGKVDGMLAPFGFTDNVEIALSAEAHSQTAAHLRYIVDGHDADRAHRSDLNDQYGTTPTSGTARRQISPLPFGRGRSSIDHRAVLGRVGSDQVRRQRPCRTLASAWGRRFGSIPTGCGGL